MKKHNYFLGLETQRVGLIVFLVALGWHLVYFFTHQQLTFGGVCINGVPFSDAMDWHTLGKNIEKGLGFSGSWSAQRPLYPLLLACCSLVFGDGFIVGKMLNIVASAVAVCGVFVIGEKLYDRYVALCASVFLLSNMVHLNYALTLMTEPTGLMFSVLTIYCLIESVEKQSLSYGFWAGLFYGASNLVRPLTLFVLPLYFLCMLFFLKRNKVANRKVLCLLSVVFLGVLISIGPWLVRQKMVHGIVTITNATAEWLYMATNPRYGNWSGDVEYEMEQAEKFTIKDKYDYQMQQARENIQKYPVFYMANLAKSFVKYLLSFKIPYVPSLLMMLLVVGGMVLSVVEYKKSYALFLTVTLLFVGVGLALVGGGGIDERVFVLVDWVFLYCAAASVLFIITLCRKKLKKLFKQGQASSPNASPQERGQQQASIFLPLCWGLLGLFLCAGGYLVVVTYHHFHGASGVPVQSLTEQQQVAIARELHARVPQLIGPEEVDTTKSYEKKVPFLEDVANQGRLFIKRGTITEYQYFLERDSAVNHWSSLFWKRPYSRTIVLIDSVGWAIFPGALDKKLTGKDCIICGRCDVFPQNPYQGRVIREGCAIIPAAVLEQPAAWNEAVIFQDQYHGALLEWLQKNGSVPYFAEAHNNLGTALAAQGQSAEAITHFREALRLEPSGADARNNLGVALAAQGHYAEALAQHREVLRRQPDQVPALNSLAWVLATAPEAGLRDSAGAVQAAKRACELTGHKDPSLLDTLAAAYAEAGRFAEAVATARKAASLATAQGQEELAAQIGQRTALYEKQQPYREPTSARPDSRGK